MTDFEYISEEKTMPERALSELLYGKGAHANPLACVEDVSVELAGRRVEGFPTRSGNWSAT